MLNNWDEWEPGDMVMLWAVIICVALVLLCCGCCGGDVFRAMLPGPQLGEY